MRPDVDVAGRHVVVCGGSPAALGVITDLHAAGAVITVYAVSVPTTVRDLADRSLLTWHRRAWSETDLAGAALVVPAAADRAENDRIGAAARAAGRLSLVPADQELAGSTGQGSGTSPWSAEVPATPVCSRWPVWRPSRART